MLGALEAQALDVAERVDLAQLPDPAVLALKAQLLDLADLKGRLLDLAHRVVAVRLLELADLVEAARLPALAHRVVEAAALLQLLLSRQSFSAAMARSTP